jgi:hypothetical protein
MLPFSPEQNKGMMPFYADPFQGMIQSSQMPNYGMVPTPFATPPHPVDPPLFPAMTPPQVNPPFPFQNPNLMQAQYARGGEVRMNGLEGLAQGLSQYGQGDDQILAHINPEEANFLAQYSGGTINPMTGLPQFGLFDFMSKAVDKAFGEDDKGGWATPFIAPALTAVGSAIGMPYLGLIATGGLGGALSNSANPLAGAIQGAITSAINHGGKSNTGSGLGNWLGGGSPASAGASAPFSTHAPTALSNVLSGQAASGGASSGGVGDFFSKLLGSGGKGGGESPFNLNNALLTTAVLGTLMRKEEKDGPQSYDEAIAQSRPRWRPEDQPRQIPASRARGIAAPQGYRPGYDPEHEYYKNELPFKRGGYLQGSTGGQADKIPAMLSDGEYVIPADIVSDAGDGNNQAGAQKFDALIRNMRHHKGRKGFPPQAKPLTSYMRT